MTLTAFSADSHITEPGDCYLPYIDPAFRDRAPVAITSDVMGAAMSIDNGRSVIPYGMVAAAGRTWDQIGPTVYVGWDELHPGGWDAKARLVEQDRDGVGAEVLYPSVGMLLCNHPDVDYKKACFDAYNQWLSRVRRGRSAAADRPRADGAAQRRGRHRRPRTHRGLGLRGVMLPGFAGCYDGSGREGDYDDPMLGPVLARRRRAEAAAVVPHPDRQRQPRRRRVPRAEDEQLPRHHPRLPGHHRHA